MNKRYDIVIIGGGLAGNVVARQVRRRLPSASILLLEAKKERTHKVGESTVEIAANYFTRRLGLSKYLYEEHLPKNALRYFFDSEDRNASLTEMSEIGANALPLFPSFQIDRSRFETDLLEMNRNDDIDIEIGARVSELTLEGASDSEPHRLKIQAGGEEHEVSARWVVDASGRESLIAKQRDLRVREDKLRIAAAWGRFENIADIDQVDSKEFGDRVDWTSRHLSTNHFMYPGYWIWLIPLRKGRVSIGLVRSSESWGPDLHRPEGFLEELGQHRAVRELIEGADQIDHAAFTQLAYRTKQFFSADRWACVGDSAAFTDPFYSPGSDFIAVESDLTTELIARDLGGDEFRSVAKMFDAFMKHRFDLTMMLYEDQYSAFGSYAIFNAKCYYDTAGYYNYFFGPYARDEHLDPDWIQRQLRFEKPAIRQLREVQDLFTDAEAELRKQGRFFEHNTGEMTPLPQAAFGFNEGIRTPQSDLDVFRKGQMIVDNTKKMLADFVNPA
ncbi:MAG: NAD(P)/FAD-dependent oxidoreductase [Sandaracinaceae bacterium]